MNENFKLVPFAEHSAKSRSMTKYIAAAFALSIAGFGTMLSLVHDGEEDIASDKNISEVYVTDAVAEESVTTMVMAEILVPVADREYLPLSADAVEAETEAAGTETESGSEYDVSEYTYYADENDSGEDEPVAAVTTVPAETEAPAEAEYYEETSAETYADEVYETEAETEPEYTETEAETETETEPVYTETEAETEPEYAEAEESEEYSEPEIGEEISFAETVATYMQMMGVDPEAIERVSRFDVPDWLTLDENGIPTQYKEIHTGKSCAYTAEPDSLMSTGGTVFQGYVAVDPDIIPYGSELYIVSNDGLVYGYAIAADTGYSVREGHIIVDLFMDEYDDCIEWGARQVTIYVLK